MYRYIQSGHKGILVSISLIALISAAVYSDHADAAGFKSEDELIDETRANVEKHLNDKWQASSPVIKDKAVVEEKIPAVVEESKTIPPQSEIKSEELPSEVITMDPETNSVTVSDKAAEGEDIDFVKGADRLVQVKPLVEPVLKKMDVSRIGASPYYETYEGLRLLKYFTVAQRVEIYQEARPIDSYILDAFAIRNTNWPHVPWNINSDYRTQLTPLFTRAYGTEVTFSDPKNKEGQIRYTKDYREIYRNYYPKWPWIKKEMWDQNEVLFMHSKQIEPLGWNYTSNLGYRYSTMNDKEDPEDLGNSYHRIRQTYFGSLSLAPNDKLEWFGQAEYFKDKFLNIAWTSHPEHFMGRTELRIKSNDMKTMFVPSISYSKDYFYPFADTYQKYEIQYRVGRDFTKRFSATSTAKYVMGFVDTPDHENWPDGVRTKSPYKAKAYTLSSENRFSYNVYDRLYLQAGADVSNGLNWSIFDNVAFLGGLEYYAPGMIRIDVGWTGNYYYNVQDFMSSVYFKFYLFM